MPAYEVVAPNGKKYRVNAPDGATQDDAIAYVQQNMYQAEEAPKPGFGERLEAGIRDIPRQLGLTARYGIEGAASTVGLLSDPIAATLGAARGRRVQTAAETGASLADAIGLPQPQTATERVVGQGARMMMGAGAGAGAAAKIAPMLAGNGQVVAQTLAMQPGMQLASGAGAGTAGQYAKETGGGDMAQFAAAVAGGVGAPAALNAAARLPAAAARSAKAGVEWLAPGLSKPMPQQIDIVIENALANSGFNWADIPSAAKSALRQDIAKSMAIGDDLNPDAVRRLAAYRITGAQPSRAGLTLDPADVTRQRNAAKFGINTDDPKLQALGRLENDNNRQLLNSLNDLGAGGVDDVYTGGSKLFGALQARNDAAQGQIGAAYGAARDSAGRPAPLDNYSFANRFDELLNESNLRAFVPAEIRNMVNDFASGKQPLTVQTAEQFKTIVGNAQRSATSDGNVRYVLGQLRQALDETPLVTGSATGAPQLTGTGAAGVDLGQEAIDAFTQARGLNRDWMQTVERTPALQAVREGGQPDNFVRDFLVGNTDKSSVSALAALKHQIKDSPEAMQEVRGQMLAHLKRGAIGSAQDEVGNFSAAGFRKALEAIGDPKLKLFFSPEELAQIKALRDVSGYEVFQPRGAAVNNSNTAAMAMAQIFDKIGSNSLLSKIPLGPALVGKPAQNIAMSLQARGLQNIPQSLVRRPPPAKLPPATYLFPMANTAGLLGVAE